MPNAPALVLKKNIGGRAHRVVHKYTLCGDRVRSKVYVGDCRGQNVGEVGMDTFYYTVLDISANYFQCGFLTFETYDYHRFNSVKFSLRYSLHSQL